MGLTGGGNNSWATIYTFKNRMRDPNSNLSLPIVFLLLLIGLALLISGVVNGGIIASCIIGSVIIAIAIIIGVYSLWRPRSGKDLPSDALQDPEQQLEELDELLEERSKKED